MKNWKEYQIDMLKKHMSVPKRKKTIRFPQHIYEVRKGKVICVSCNKAHKATHLKLNKMFKGER